LDSWLALAIATTLWKHTLWQAKATDGIPLILRC